MSLTIQKYWCHICSKHVTIKLSSENDCICDLCGNEFVEIQEVTEELENFSFHKQVEEQRPSFKQSSVLDSLQSPLVAPKFRCKCESIVCPLVGAIFSNHTGEKRSLGINLFRKIAENILKNLSEEKFRRVSLNKVKTTLETVPELYVLLETVGFRLEGIETKCYVLSLSTDLSLLKDALLRVDRFSAQSDAEYAAAVERNRLIAAENQAQIEAESSEKAARRAAILKESDDNRSMKSFRRPTESSFAKKLRFGAVMKDIPKPPPPPPAG